MTRILCTAAATLVMLGLVAATAQAGESFFEPPGSTRAVSDDQGRTKLTRLLAVFVAPSDTTNITPGEAP